MPRRPTPYYPDYAIQSLTIAPSWVWDRAFKLVNHNHNVSLRRDGPDIARVMRYLRAGIYGYRGHWRLHHDEDPDIYAAVQFFEGLGQASNTAELQLKCHVLAGRSIGWLAATYDITRSVMQTYLKTYFDVRDRLSQRGYILHRVIGLLPKKPPGGYELALLHAYEMGPEAVEPWVDWFQNAHEQHDLSTPEGRSREAISLAVDTQRHTPTLTQSNRLRILETKMPEITRKMFRTRSPSEQLVEIQAAKLAALGFKNSDPADFADSQDQNQGSFRSACENETIAATR